MVAFVDDNNPYIADVLGKLPQISKIHTYKGREFFNRVCWLCRPEIL